MSELLDGSSKIEVGLTVQAGVFRTNCIILFRTRLLHIMSTLSMYSRTPINRTPIIRLANYPDQMVLKSSIEGRMDVGITDHKKLAYKIVLVGGISRYLGACNSQVNMHLEFYCIYHLT